MRVLYVAAGIPVPGAIGGSTHVLEVSRGLAALGHEVLVVAGAASSRPPISAGDERGAPPRPLNPGGSEPLPGTGSPGRRRVGPAVSPQDWGAGGAHTWSVVNLGVPKELSLLLYPALARLAAAFGPDVVMEP